MKSAQELAAEHPAWEICEVAVGGQVSTGFSDRGPVGIRKLFFDAVLVDATGGTVRVGRSEPFETHVYGVDFPPMTETHDQGEVRAAFLAQLQQEGWEPLPGPDGQVQGRNRLRRPKLVAGGRRM